MIHLKPVKKGNNKKCTDCFFQHNEKYNCIKLLTEGKRPTCSRRGANLIFKKVEK